MKNNLHLLLKNVAELNFDLSSSLLQIRQRGYLPSTFFATEEARQRARASAVNDFPLDAPSGEHALTIMRLKP